VISTTIEQNEFVVHYGRNRSNNPSEIVIEEYSDFVRQTSMKINEAEF
jgi:hypothetical protein